MDGNLHSISPVDLYARLGTAAAPVVVDVRREGEFDDGEDLIIGAIRPPANDIVHWLNKLPHDRRVVTYCRHGREVSQNVAAAMNGAGIQAGYLEGGIAGWKRRQLPTRLQRGPAEDKWVTREHPKIDRIACPWLVSRFINPLAEFLYVPASDVLAVAEETGATPYDIKGVEFGHQGDRCSFDAILGIYDIDDPALEHLAKIVRGADTSRPDLAPQCEGLLAISRGLSANFPDDHEMLAHGMIIYDALYTWCRGAQLEANSRPSTRPAEQASAHAARADR